MTSLAAVQKTPDPVIVSLPDAPPLSLEEFRSKDQQDCLPEIFQLRKAYACEEVKLVGDEESRLVQFVISTHKVDRHRDTIDPVGWDLANYHKGGPGPVLWAHSHLTPSLGGGTAEVKGKRLVAQVDFAPAEVHPLANTVFQLIKGNYGQKGASVGFMPKKHVYDDERGGYDFKEQELLEFSMVNVGANPDALRKAAADGIDVQPAIDEAIKVLDGAYQSEGLWIPKAKALAVVKALGYGSGVKFFDLGTADIRDRVKRKISGSAEDPAVNVIADLEVDSGSNEPASAFGHVSVAEVEPLTEIVVAGSIEELAYEPINISAEQLDSIADRIADRIKASPVTRTETDHESTPAENSEPVLLVESDTTPRYSIDLSLARAVLHELLEPKAEEIKRQFTRVTGQVVP